MNSQSRIRLSIVSSIGFSLLIAFIAFHILRGMNEEFARTRVLTEVIDKTQALHLLTTSFMEGASRSDIRQIKGIVQSLGSDIMSLTSRVPREETLILQLRKSHQEIRPLIDQLVSLKTPASGSESDRLNILASHVRMKIQYIADDSKRLRDVSKSRITSAQEKTVFTIILLIVILALTTGAIYFFSGRGMMRAENALRESQERLALAASGTRSGIYDRDISTGKSLWTEQVAGILGLRSTATTTTTTLSLSYHYQDWADRVHREDLLRVEAEQSRCMSERLPFEAEYRVVWPDGSVHWVSDRGVFQFESDGHCTRMLGIIMDITERKRAEEALEKATQQTEIEKQRLQTILETSPSAVVVVEAPDGRFSFMNKRALALYGVDYKGVDLNTNVAKIKASRPDGRTCGVDEVPASRALWKGEVVRNEEWTIYRADDVPIPVLASAAPIRNAQGDIVSAVVMFEDITERKKAEEALRESEELYRGVVENTTAVILRINPAGIITFANQRALNFFGFSTEELIGRHVLGTIVPSQESSGRDLAELVDQIIANPDGFHTCANENICKDGRLVWLEWTNSGIYGPAGQLKETLSVGIDATARKKAEEELRLALDRLQTFFDHRIGGIGIVIAKAGGGIIQANDYYLDILGCTREKLLSGEVDWRKITPPEWLPADEHALAQLREKSVCDSYEKEYQRPDGTRVPVLITDAILPGDSGDILGFVLDITERKKAEEGLAAAHRQVQSIIDNTTSIVYALDLEERFLLVNSALAELLNSTPAQIIGKRRHELMPKDDADWHEANDRQVIEAGSALEFEEYSQLKGRSITWLTTKFPLRDAQGRIYAVGGISTDVSERKRTEEVLRKYRDELEIRVQERTAELERKNQELQEFAYVASHDLSEPLRKVQTFGDLLKARAAERLTGVERDYVARMTGAANRMQELLDALLRYSRLETQARDPVPLKLQDILQMVTTDLEVSIKQAGADLEMGALPVIKGDPYQWRQVFQNLIANAIKYHRSEVKPRIKVHSEQNGNSCRILVEDNGIGFDEKYLDKIFQPFQRLHGKHEYPGTGIGLAICKKIVERHGGSITAKSTPGKGSTFILTLPAKNLEPDR
ncbi:MAG: PAS domain S-box protein [Desulfobacteraceae bacterium]|nr:MAG: PAS domain S-box protein [Desulfobacteraceae bacterium]